MIRTALGADQLQVMNGKLFSASVAFLASGTPFHFELEILERSLARQSLEGKIERVLIHVGQFADAHPDGKDLHIRVTLRFGGNAVENRRGNSDFVHKVSLTDPR